MTKPSQIRAISGLLALGVVSSALDVAVLAPSALSRTKPALSRTTSAVELRLRRSTGRVEVVIAGLGTKVRAVSQNQSDGRWSARLTGVDLGDRPFMPQQTVLSSSELLSVRLEPLESDLQLIVKARMGERVPTPTIGSNGDSLVVTFSGLTGPEPRSIGRLDLRRPGRVAQPVMAPPMRPRASAPPLGDMAVGTMLINNRSYVQANGPSVSLTLNNAPAKDALMSLARLGGYGFVYVGESDPNVDTATVAGVTMAFRDERFDRALNSVLLAAGLQAKLDGRTLIVGTSVSSKTFGPQMSKVFRLNQVKVDKAADYLASLGASMSVINTITTTTGEASSAGTSQLSNRASQTMQKTTKVETYGASVGPLLGLAGTTDTRLGTVTLVGDPQLISSAESYLKQLDLRRRQVAVKVQILNVSLNNDEIFDSSFSARMGDTFIVSDSGNGHLNFGQYKPGGPVGSGIYGQGASGVPGTYSNYGQVPQQNVIDPVVEDQAVLDPVIKAQREVIAEDGTVTFVDELDDLGRPIYVPDSNPTAGNILIPLVDSNGRTIYVPDSNPSESQVLKPVYDDKGRLKYVPGSDQYRQPDNSFYAYLEAQIVARNAKTLAQPTLLVQEGQQASVETGQDYVVNVERNENGETGTTTYTYEKETAGLTLGLNVDKIDDNGFVTMNVNPSVSIPVPASQSPGADTGGVQIFNLNKRDLKSGSIRLRDGQTLILTGVVSEQQVEEVKKWPILGDLPLLGSLFRSSQSQRLKDELVILVTPRILDGDQGGVFGYGYRPATKQATQLMQSGS